MTLVPARPHPGVREHLSAVEDLLAERLARLGQQWRQGSRTTDFVLGPDDVPELLGTLVKSGGKRLRPQMCWWGWVASGAPERHADPAPVVGLSAAMELLHAFGLAQDDVMDESVLRRGLPTVHVVAAGRHRAAGATGDPGRYGESIAVLAGDLAHAEANALIAGLNEPVRSLWWRMTIELVRGQARDLSSAAHARGTSREAVMHALEVANAKSGAYTVQRPLELGALAGGAGPGVVQALGRFGQLVGEAFALRDDLLGVWGDPDVTGKPSSDDLAAGKATVLLALAEQRCTGPARAAVTRMRRHCHDDRDVSAVRDAMVDTGVRDEVEQRIVIAVDQALNILRDAALPVSAIEGLEAVTERIAWRRS